MNSLNISFNGYKNIIATANTKMPNNKSVTYIAMQLDDEGQHDLSEYKKLRRMQGFIENSKDDDLLLLTYIRDVKQNTEDIYLGTKNMFLGDELRYIEANYVPKMISYENYEKEKALHMKAYTLLASLTKRIVDEQFNHQEGISKVIEYINNTLNHLQKNNIPIFNAEQSFRLVEYGCLGCFKFQDIAKGFNKGIAYTMSKYFGCKI